MKLSRSLCLAWLVSAAAALPVAAETKLSALFSDNMVLQQKQELPIWGTDDKGTEVTVTLGDAKASAKADDNGKWICKLPAQKATESTELTISGSSKKTFKNVAIGEVWICSGQSNMEMTVVSSKNGPQEVAAAKYPGIRHIKLEHTLATSPQEKVPSNAGWQTCTPQTVGPWTGVGYFFARDLQKELGCPIGLIGTNWGGSAIEPWTPPEGFKQVPVKGFSDKLEQFTKGKPAFGTPTAMYNAMIAPLVPYAIQGALWYQGESNNGQGMLYADKMKALITGWRKVWNRDDMPFYYVQLAPFRYSNPKGDRSLQLPGIWEAQAATLAVPHTGMAATTDTLLPNEITNIHPTNKQEVGKRLALCALAKTYGKSDLVYSGPIYKSSKVEGNKVRITFDSTGGGLASRDGKPLTWFTIAGADKKYVEAKAEIDGDTVVVSSESIDKPIAVRFAWNEEAQPNLANKAGLPAICFRTDK